MDLSLSPVPPPKLPYMRPRKTDRHLPACVYHRHGAYWLVKKGKWTRLSADLADALAEYARLIAQPTGGMAAMIDELMPVILRGKKPATVKQYQVAARRLREILAEFSPDQVRPVHVAQIQTSFEATPSVANRTVTVLRLLCDRALKLGYVESNPCIGLVPLRVAARDRLLTPAEFAAIYAKAGDRLRVIMDLCYLTGQRIGDVLAIRRADLTDEGIAFKQEKTGKRLIVAWTPELRRAVESAKNLTRNVTPLTLFYAKGGKTPGYKIIWRQWKTACKLANVANANIHDLRALSGTDADRQGIDAQALLGHTDPKMTRRYLRDRSAKVVSGPRVLDSDA
jgi:integrase